jgi:phosphoketolase
MQMPHARQALQNHIQEARVAYVADALQLRPDSHVQRRKQEREEELFTFLTGEGTGTRPISSFVW